MNNDDVWYDPVPEPVDPCNRRCGVSSETGLCRGCQRTLEEISDWDKMSKDERQVVLDKVALRWQTGARERNWDLPADRKSIKPTVV